jgi:hypothetical protein
MEPIRLTTQEALIYLALVGAGVGLLLGLIPLFFGIRKGKTRLGVIALVASTIAGAITSIISIILVVIFTYLILKKPSMTSSADNRSPEPAGHESDTQ